MIIKYYGTKEAFMNKARAFCLQNGYSLRINGLSVLIDNHEFTISEGSCEFRTFSVPKIQHNVLRIEGPSALNDYKLVEFMENISLAYSEAEQNTIWNDMPILQMMSQQRGHALVDAAIIFRDHFLEDNMALLRAFEECGVEASDILVFDKGDRTKRQEEITKTFINRGYNVELLDNAIVENPDLMEQYKQRIEDFCNNRKNKKVIIMDDGAIVTKLLCKEKITNIIGIVELTEMGLRRIKSSDIAKEYTIIDAAKTQLKRNITYSEIANAIVKRILELLYGTKLVGRTVMILGYGDLGSILAERFRAWGVNVVVYDTNKLRLIVAAENGFKTYDNPVEAAKNENIFMLIGSSGYRSIDKKLLEQIDGDIIVTAGATADALVLDEIPYDELYAIEDYGIQIHTNNRVITRLGNGRSINLFLSESIPNQANDIFKAANLLCAILLIEKAERLGHGLHLDVVDRYLQESGIYDVYYDKYFK